tara:strand:+ start:255 stop:746 length:492 start_codon:yes stop_codon:yes gene_type:complete
MPNLKIQFYLKLIFVISFISIVSAYFIQYVLGHQPCNLCLIERIPYVLCIFLIIINYKYKKEKILFLLLILIFIFSLGVSIYHFGIEQDFFEESTICGLKDSTKIITKEELLRQLNERVISCKDVTFRIFGFSLTTINIFLSLILIIISTKCYKIYEKLEIKN